MKDGKLQLLYTMKLLLEETDRDHILNAVDICNILETRWDLSSTRKTVYMDVEKLRDYGMKIEQVKGKVQGYYVEEREFTLPELKLLVDAVQSSKFITTRKSEELIKKLEAMTTHENGRQLQRQVFIYNRPKTDNETIYQAVDVIHSAIYANRQIRFKYCEWTVNKKLVQRKNGADYIVSPWSLTWDDENYYLVAYDEAVGQIRHYRVDKMQELAQLETARKGREQFENFDLAAFAKKTFGMFGGKDEKVTLVCRNELAGVILDRFGTDIMMIPSGPDCFRTPVTVSVSSQFFGWLTGIGSGIRIESPAKVKEEYKRYLQGILDAY